MKDLLDKLSSYNIFNYLLPGIVFVAAADTLTNFSFVQKDIVIGVFVYYFIGLVISRVGSLILEPLLKAVRFLNFSEYSAFVAASKSDVKLEVLSEVNNMYRTFSAAFMLLLLLMGYEKAVSAFPALAQRAGTVLALALLAMFVLSYRKQTAYITKRIEAETEGGVGDE